MTHILRHNHFESKIMPFYRFVSENTGIFEAVNRDCPAGHYLRNNKPDGSWLPKAGARFPGAISFWTDYGLKVYLESGLQDWHRRAVRRPVSVVTIDDPGKLLYQDQFQAIATPDREIAYINRKTWDEFVFSRFPDQITEKVVVYLLRNRASSVELLVFSQPKFPEAGIQVPAGTINRGESPEVAAIRELGEEAGSVGKLVSSLKLMHQTHLVRHPF
jgi:hypothetical protein